MGILIAGPFGGFYRKTGPLVGRRGKAKNVITGLHHKSTQPFSVAQLKAQDGFSRFTSIIETMRPLVNKGFKAQARKKTQLNAAYHYNYGKAFFFDEGQPMIDFTKLVYSQGQTAIPNCPKVQLVGSQMEFSWLPDQQSPYNLLNDKASFLIYNETKGVAIIHMAVANRSQLTFILELPIDFLGDVLYCYMNFDAADGKTVGDSVYLGVF